MRSAAVGLVAAGLAIVAGPAREAAAQVPAAVPAAPSTEAQLLPAALKNQFRPPPPAAAQLFAGLAITPDQRTELVAITARARGERLALLGVRGAGSSILPAEMAALGEIANSQRAAIDAVITPVQRARLASNVAAARTARVNAVRAHHEVVRDSIARAAKGGQRP